MKELAKPSRPTVVRPRIRATARLVELLPFSLFQFHWSSRRYPGRLVDRAVTPSTKLNKACVAQRCRLLNVVALRTNRRLSTAPRHNFFVTMSGRSNLGRHRREDSITSKTCSLIPRRLKLQTYIGFVHTNLQGPVPQRSPNQQARRSLRVH